MTLNQHPAVTSLGHLPQLDGMRAAAILIVLLGHSRLVPGVPGGFGVTLFFFLSGYLITSLLRIESQQTGAIDLGRFYLRRTVRIIPPMVITILFVIGLQLAGLLPMQAAFIPLVSDLLFMTNYANLFGIQASVRIPLWSLDVEEHFYILFSTLYALWLARRTPVFGAMFCAAACVVVLGIRLGYAAFDPDALGQVYYWSHTRMDSILFGCILALWRNPVLDERPFKPGFLLFALALAAIAFSFVWRDPVFRETWRYTLQGCALLVVFAWVLSLRRRAAELMSCWPLRWCALLSSTLYLIHFPILKMFEQFGVPQAWIPAYAFSIAFSLGMYVIVERPLGSWRRSIEAGWSGQRAFA